MRRYARSVWPGLVALAIVLGAVPPAARGAVTRAQVEKAIKNGVRYLKDSQRGDGSWFEVDPDHNSGSTSLVVLSLLTAGEPANSPAVQRALAHLRNFTPELLKSTYAVSLQTMVYAAASPDRDQLRIAANVAWLERAQIKAADRKDWPGSWTYNEFKSSRGDGSNTQYALLGLNAAAEVGVPVKPEVWTLARSYWEMKQNQSGSFSYTPETNSQPTASMTCAGISSLVITGLKRFQGQEFLEGNEVRNCGKGGFNLRLQDATTWISRNFSVFENRGQGQQWKFYYLYGLERAGRLTGQRYFGEHDWYREGAEILVRLQDPAEGFWRGVGAEAAPHIATSFSLLFLAKGRSPVLINKLRHGPRGDWNNDPDDVRNLTNLVSRDWKNLLTWQVVDPNISTVQDLMQAPILFMNGHEAPEFNEQGKKNLRDFVEQGGFIFAEACCGRPEFDKGFNELMTEVFPEPEYKLHPLAEDHVVWRSRHTLKPEIHPLFGIEHGCRTVVIYSPSDLSCYWNLSESNASNTAVIKSLRVGQNVVEYATGREMPADKLDVRDVRDFRPEAAKRGAYQIAKLRHAGDWNVAPLAVPNLMSSIRDKLKMDVVINHRELFPRDPNLVNFPLIYIHGRASVSFSPEDMAALKKHLEPGGGTFFADAACGSPAFDASFRKFIAELLPESPLVPIPRDDDIYTKRVGYDLSDVQYTKPAGGGRDLPQLEGVKLNGHWAVIYSKLDLGCALERHQGLDCKGYTPESALRIASNIVLYATLP